MAASFEKALHDADLADLAESVGDSGGPGRVAHVQTHISHVFLTDSRVYKFRKAVDLGFVRFRTRAERNADCLREVALNRRLAPDVYLGIAPLLREKGRAGVGPIGEVLAQRGGRACEHCVVMRRLPEGRDALSLLEHGELTEAQLDRLAGRIATFHAEHGLGTPAPFRAEAWRERVRRPVEDNFQTLASSPEIADPELLARARDRSRAFLDGQAHRFERRRRAGRIVDGHGDLHLQHIWFESDSAEPLVIDCLEFSDALRQIDVASELAFAAMDLRYRRAAGLAERLLAAYARESDDFDLYAVVDFFVAYRAGVRAKVAAIAAGESEIDAQQRSRAADSAGRHLDLASAALAPRGPARLILVTGSVGSGKTTAAAEIAAAAGGVTITSDRVRKKLAGLAPEARTSAPRDQGIYSDAHTERTYAGLLERARPVLESGRLAVLDATFARRRHRETARDLAQELGVPIFCVETRCSDAIARARLARRVEAGRDASDAGPELLAASRARFEALAEWPDGAHLEAHTDHEDWRERLRSWAASLASPAAAA